MCDFIWVDKFEDLIKSINFINLIIVFFKKMNDMIFDKLDVFYEFLNFDEFDDFNDFKWVDEHDESDMFF